MLSTPATQSIVACRRTNARVTRTKVQISKGASMRSILRLSTFLAVLVFASIHPLLNAQAQGNGTPQCYGLSAADCKILTAADANLSKELSFQYDYEFTMSFAGSLTSFA